MRSLVLIGAGSAVFVDPVWSLSGIVQGLTGVGGVAIMAFWICGPRLAEIEIASSRPGNASSASITRMSNRSVTPPT